ncbi:hypothetical protein [Mesorhizobium sp. B1-1-7]|uniref:hypothetical protein n=1 Tax=Mesorhizobium sp. B1-1-7 TaxID=2589977 RepID=UPI00112D6D6E|nr:hypothetical protein [Mesorhizobium sp. B1-1-7]TPN57172.1 hypothetical protein FJ978_00690 [Mesorhizobium sp. B1-1-7]
MFLYKAKFGDNPTFAPNFADVTAHENEERQAAQDLWDTSRDLQLYKENANAEQNARAEAYDRRNKAIFDATGVQFDNPMKSFDIFRLKPEPGAGGLPESSVRDDIAASEKAWQDKASALARERPEFATVIAADRPIIDDAYGIARDAEKAAGTAQARAQDVGLGRGSKLANSFGGGFAGAMRDPLQVATLFAGGGIASPARAFGWRLLETVLSEAAVNGGIEAGVQAASYDWKARAGLEHSVGGSLEQVGMAALFGGALGGLMEGGRTVFRLLGKPAPEEALQRAAAGTPEPGDIKTIADAAGVKLDADSARAAELAAEQPHLDAEAFGPVPEGLDPVQAEQLQARALREADAPDNALPTPVDRQARGEAVDRIVQSQFPVGPAPARPVTLTQFLASKSVGGIKDESGALTSMGLSRKFVPGGGALVRKTGKSLDYAREAAAEAGYFDDLYGDPQTAVARSTPDDLLRAIERERDGQPVFSPRHDGGRVFDWQEHQAGQMRQQAFRRVVEEVDGAIDALGIDHRIDDAVLTRAAALVDDETDPVMALERALDEDYRNYADALSERGEEAPDATDIPFFDSVDRQDAGAGAGAGVPVGETRQGGQPRGRGAAAPDGQQLPRAGADEEPQGLRQLGDTPEPATPEAADNAAVALQEARTPSTEKTAAGEQTLLEGVKPVSTKEKLEAQGAKPLKGGDKALPEGGLFDLESRKQLDIWDAMPAAKNADGTVLHATYETMTADADRTEFFGDLIGSCKD